MDFMVNMAVDFFLLRSSVGITKEVAKRPLFWCFKLGLSYSSSASASADKLAIFSASSLVLATAKKPPLWQNTALSTPEVSLNSWPLSPRQAVGKGLRCLVISSLLGGRAWIFQLPSRAGKTPYSKPSALSSPESSTSCTQPPTNRSSTKTLPEVCLIRSATILRPR